MLSYFGGCDYFRMASHPVVIAAVGEGVRRFGLNVAASRATTGNHALYPKLEKQLAQFFKGEAALLVSNGYVTNLVAVQALAGNFSHALIDERAHASLVDASSFLDCPVLKFEHRDPADASRALKRCGTGARPILLTDGMFSHDGSVAPLRAYLKLLPRDGWVLVDDAHGAGTLGATGRGSIELEGVSRRRIIQSITLSKAFGVYGGAVICARDMRERMTGTRMFIGGTPLPLPLAYAVSRSLEILGDDRSFRVRLNQNASRVKQAVRKMGFNPAQTPGPIVRFDLNEPREVSRLKRTLLAAGILPPLIHYLGGPKHGYFRFVISSEHTPKQLDTLIEALSRFCRG